MLSFLGYFFKAVFVGFAMTAPVGPVALLCIRKTLEQGMKAAVSIGIGSTMVKIVLGLIAGLGFTAISKTFFLGNSLFKSMGGLLMLAIALKEMSLTRKKCETVSLSSTYVPSGFLALATKTFLMGMTNPVAVIAFFGVFAAMSGPAVLSACMLFLLLLGLSIGSILWWLLLGYGITKIKNHFSDAWISRIHYVSAAIIAVCGIGLLVSAFLEHHSLLLCAIKS